MGLTNCPKCKLVLSVDTFDNIEKCPACGKSFNKHSYSVMFKLWLSPVALIWIAYWTSFRNDKAFRFAIFATCVAATWCLIVIIADQILLRVFQIVRVRRDKISFTLATATVLIVISWLSELIFSS